MKTFKQSTLLFSGLLLLAATSCKKTGLAPSNQRSLSSSTTQNAASVFHSSQRINDESYNWDPCTGEFIHFTGYAQIVFDFVRNGNKISGVYHYNAEGEKGEGLSSGIQYQGVGAINQSFSGSLINGAYTYNSATRITMVTSGKGDNFIWSSMYHLTFNANGEVTVTRDNFSLTCQ